MSIQPVAPSTSIFSGPYRATSRPARQAGWPISQVSGAQAPRWWRRASRRVRERLDGSGDVDVSNFSGPRPRRERFGLLNQHLQHGRHDGGNQLRLCRLDRILQQGQRSSGRRGRGQPGGMGSRSLPGHPQPSGPDDRDDLLAEFPESAVVIDDRQLERQRKRWPSGFTFLTLNSSPSNGRGPASSSRLGMRCGFHSLGSARVRLIVPQLAEMLNRTFASHTLRLESGRPKRPQPKCK